MIKRWRFVALRTKLTHNGSFHLQLTHNCLYPLNSFSGNSSGMFIAKLSRNPLLLDIRRVPDACTKLLLAKGSLPEVSSRPDLRNIVHKWMVPRFDDFPPQGSNMNSSLNQIFTINNVHGCVCSCYSERAKAVGAGHLVRANRCHHKYETQHENQSQIPPVVPMDAFHDRCCHPTLVLFKARPHPFQVEKSQQTPPAGIGIHQN